MHVSVFSSSALALLSSTASQAGVTVDFDGSVLIQFVAFIILFLLIKPLLLDPFLRVIEERERRTIGAKDEAREMDEKAADIIRRYEAELEKVRRVAGEERERMRSEAQKLEARILGQAREAADRVVEEGRARIAKEAEMIRTDLRAVTTTLASDIAERVLGREVR